MNSGGVDGPWPTTSLTTTGIEVILRSSRLAREGMRPGEQAFLHQMAVVIGCTKRGLSAEDRAVIGCRCCSLSAIDLSGVRLQIL